MEPIVREFMNETELIHEVSQLSAQGIDKDNVYVLSHDADRTHRIVEEAEANEIGLKEMGLSKTIEQVFRPEGDQLRMKMEEIGLTEQEAEHYERKLDEGKILLIVDQA